MDLAHGSDGSASTGDAARKHRARARCVHKYNKLSCRWGSPLSISALPLQFWPSITLGTCNDFYMHHGSIMGPRDNLGVRSGVSWAQITVYP